MMITTNDIRDLLEQSLIGTKVYNGTINKNDKECLGIYLVSGKASNIAIGGLDNTSYGVVPISVLVHWSEDTNKCNIKANEVYETLQGLRDAYINNKRILYCEMPDSYPKNINRDAKNICEMVVRANVYYERKGYSE